MRRKKMEFPDYAALRYRHFSRKQAVPAKKIRRIRFAHRTEFAPRVSPCFTGTLIHASPLAHRLPTVSVHDLLVSGALVFNVDALGEDPAKFPHNTLKLVIRYAPASRKQL